VDRDVKVVLKTINRMGRGVQAALRDLNRLSSGAKRVGRDIARAMQQAGQRMGQTLTRAAKIGALALAGLGIAAIAVGADFEQGMANVRAITQATAEDFSILERKAREIGATTAFTARQASEAMFNLGLQGFKTAAIIGTVDATTKLAGATLTDMAGAAELMTSTMNQFNLVSEDVNKTMDQSWRVANLFTAAIASSPLNMERLRNSLTFAGVAAGQFNVSLEETIGALGILAKAGLTGSIAGTGVRRMLIDLVAPAGAAGDVIGKIDVASIGLIGALKELEQRGVSAQQVFELYNIRAAQPLAVLLSVGSEKVKELTEKMAELSGGVSKQGEAWRQYEVQMNTVRSQTKILRSALEEVAIAIFKEVAPSIRRGLESAIAWVNRVKPALASFVRLALEGFGKLVSGIREFIAENSKALLVTASVLGTIGALAVAFTLLTNPIFLVGAATFLVTKYARQLWETFKPLILFLAGAGAVILTVVAALKAWAVAQAALNLVMSLNPLTIWVAIIAAAVGAILWAIDALGGFEGAWISVKATIQVAGKVLGAIAETGKLVATSLWDNFRFFGQRMFEMFKNIGEAWKNLFSLDFGAMMESLREGFANVVDGLQGDPTFRNKLLAIWGEFGVEAGAVFDLANREKIEKGLDGIDFSGITDKINEMKSKLGGTLGQFVADNVDLAPGTSGLKQDIEKLMAEIEGAITEAGVHVAQGVDLMAETIGQRTNRLFNEMSFANQAAVEGILAVNDEMWNTIWDSDITGKERRERIWKALGKSLFLSVKQATGQVLKQYIVEALAFKSKETAKTAAAAQGEAARRGFSAKEAISNVASIASSIATAVAGALKWIFRTFPFPFSLGVAAAASATIFAIGSKLSAAAGFQRGGLVDGPFKNRDSVPAMLTPGEMVMPKETVDKFGPLLEAMLRGSFSGFQGGGTVPQRDLVEGPRSGGDIVLQVSFEGTVFTDDELSLEEYARNIEDVVRRVMSDETGGRRLRLGGATA
jgi:TP901 family phage tail tape measure protein